MRESFPNTIIKLKKSMRARFINEMNFERRKDPRKSMGLGVHEKIGGWKREYIQAHSDRHTPPTKATDNDLLTWLINENRWDDIEFLTRVPNKFFKKGTFRGSLYSLMDSRRLPGNLIEKVDFLLENGADPSFRSWSVFKNACYNGWPEVVQKMIDLGADPNDGTDIPIRKAVEGLENNHSWRGGKSAKDYWDVIKILAKNSKI